jgi:hypothetical protein
MKLKTLCSLAAICSLILTTAYSQTQTAAANPLIAHLEQRGAARQLIVDGKPFLALAGELNNTAASSPEYMKTVWPNLTKIGLNTVLVPIAWSWIEPQEGKFDFTFVDNAIRDARANHLCIAWLWFGSWKNGLSSFPPVWVMANQDRFPRAQLAGRHSVDVLSTVSEANRNADAKAFAAFMRYVRERESSIHTTVMIQLENEVGLIGDSRDRSAVADGIFAKPVPKELTDYLQAHRNSLLPETLKLWGDAGFKTSGTWEEVFGVGPAKADEVFMAWNYSRYVGKVAEAGKAEYPVPMFVNTWIVQPTDRGPGDYPSGGPQSQNHDIWRAGGPQVDMLSPDIYLPNFSELVTRYARNGNTIFIPESTSSEVGAANVFYAIGARNAVGYSAMGIDSITRMVAARPGAGSATALPADITTLPFPKAYHLIAEMTPLILDAQSKGTIGGAWLNRSNQMTDINVGGYTVNVELRQNRRQPDAMAEIGYAIVIAAGQDEFFVAGNGVQVTFLPTTPGLPIAGVTGVEAGRFENGQWVVTRRLGGDDCVLEYDQAKAAAAHQSGSGLSLMNGPSIQHVRLYRYQ